MKVFKRNNPLNIRYYYSNKWKGLIEENGGFCVFEHQDYGFRAAFILLKNYGKQGINTIAKIVRRFAPPLENPTDAYISFVARRMKTLGYGENIEKLKDLELDLGNDMLVADLVFCMALFESGVKVQLKEVRAALIRTGCIGAVDDEPLPVPNIMK